MLPAQSCSMSEGAKSKGHLRKFVAVRMPPLFAERVLARTLYLRLELSGQQVGVNAFTFMYFNDEYGPCVPRWFSDKEWKSGPRPMEKNFEGEYTVKVGAVCCVLIGQIVSRRLLAVRYQPSAGLVLTLLSRLPCLSRTRVNPKIPPFASLPFGGAAERGSSTVRRSSNHCSLCTLVTIARQKGVLRQRIDFYNGNIRSFSFRMVCAEQVRRCGCGPQARSSVCTESLQTSWL